MIILPAPCTLRSVRLFLDTLYEGLAQRVDIVFDEFVMSVAEALGLVKSDKEDSASAGGFNENGDEENGSDYEDCAANEFGTDIHGSEDEGEEIELKKRVFEDDEDDEMPLARKRTKKLWPIKSQAASTAKKPKAVPKTVPKVKISPFKKEERNPDELARMEAMQI